ncbi:ferritin, heavy subunit [Nilaparvata lugens]|uniref:ferritin, heavy subunit n=1 Tax=Nilaparvata lugens TaxID=108931 RepID=UPI00193E0099|nr:ferritin, heavy subunit [Nilaparvata lugens]
MLLLVKVFGGCVVNFGKILQQKRFKSCTSLGRSNYHPDCEQLINKQINLELRAAYFYCSLQYYFDRDDVGLPGFSTFFKQEARGEMAHAQKLMQFQRKRGGDLKLLDIEAPIDKIWSHCKSIAESLKLEKTITESLEKIAETADLNKDYYTNDFITSQFLPEQYKDIKFLASLLARIGIAEGNAGVILIDQELMGRKKPI